jgi:hypothetical protein
LLDCPSIHTLDISNNFLDDTNIVEEIFCKMPNLSVLYCKNNEFVKKIPYFRKFMIAKIKTLEHLDDRTVFEEDRRLAEAFINGDREKEKEEKEKIL